MPCIGHLIGSDTESDSSLGRFETESDSDSLMHFEIARSPTDFEYCYDVADVTLIQKIKNKISADEKFFSLEFFPPRTRDGVANLVNRMDRMNCGKPLFMDVTWHGGMSSASKSVCSSMTIASSSVNYCGIDTMLHVTSAGLSYDDMSNVLNLAKSNGIRNIMALSGDDRGQSDFKYASELVAWIRTEFGDTFTIAVAGYPEGHPDSTYEESLTHLKQKVDAGADFIITQLLFDPDKYEEFIKDCGVYGINVPIIPGVMPIQNYDSLRKLTKLASNVNIPKNIQSAIEMNKEDDEAIRELGVKFAVDMIAELFERTNAPGVHIYTLNREIGPKNILKDLSLWNTDRSRRHFPWQVTANGRRQTNEDVRPVYWALRPKSYITRTQDWDEFPNGRWGNSSNPAFGDLDDYHLFYMSKAQNIEQLRRMWGCELKDINDVKSVFLNYINGTKNSNGVKVTSLPWCDETLRPETEIIRNNIIKLNSNCFFTINSQPSINGVKSNDQTFGWGPKNGYIYQKAYIEFFSSLEDTTKILELLVNYPTLSYTIANYSNSDNYTNYRRKTSIALTWGVFPGREILQPTIADHKTFLIWKDEAFGLWKAKWGEIYEKDSISQHVIQEIVDTFYLVCLVDNDYVEENSALWTFLEKVTQHKLERPTKTETCTNGTPDGLTEEMFNLEL